MLDLSRVAPPLWRDGAGATRELAAATDAHGEMLWRISVADLEHDEPFTALFLGSIVSSSLSLPCA
ncbi:HutD family protein [Streptomyces sp. NPDC051976]|uniref:HutD family protein n=1 Tax=Streptomyces sp. NPDC051976 TaxID=3154947 RepID=UPI0034257030